MKFKSTFSLTFISFLVILSINGCGKLIDDYDANFIGIWIAQNSGYCYKISIDKNSDAQYSSCYSVFYDGTQGDCDVSSGTARIKNGKLNIGGRWFDIDMFPTKNSSGAFTCKINSILYTRQ